MISGDAAAVADAVGRIKASGGKVLPLNVSGAFHSPLMTDAAAAFAETIDAAAMSEPLRPVVDPYFEW